MRQCYDTYHWPSSHVSLTGCRRRICRPLTYWPIDSNTLRISHECQTVERATICAKGHARHTEDISHTKRFWSEKIDSGCAVYAMLLQAHAPKSIRTQDMALYSNDLHSARFDLGRYDSARCKLITVLTSARLDRDTSRKSSIQLIPDQDQRFHLTLTSKISITGDMQHSTCGGSMLRLVRASALISRRAKRVQIPNRTLMSHRWNVPPTQQKRMLTNN